MLSTEHEKSCSHPWVHLIRQIARPGHSFYLFNPLSKEVCLRRNIDRSLSEQSNVLSVPGIGPKSLAPCAGIGTGDGFSKGRDFAAWMGLMPK